MVCEVSLVQCSHTATGVGAHGYAIKCQIKCYLKNMNYNYVEIGPRHTRKLEALLDLVRNLNGVRSCFHLPLRTIIQLVLCTQCFMPDCILHSDVYCEMLYPWRVAVW